MDVLGAEDVHRLLDYPSLIAALDEAHRQAPPVTSRVFLEAADENRPAGEGFLVLPAWSTGRDFGTKLVTLLPDNAVKQNGYPTVQAIYPYFDGETGAPKAVIDGTALTLRKTAADSALASSMLSRSDAETLLMVGAGALAPHLIAAHLADGGLPGDRHRGYYEERAIGGAAILTLIPQVLAAFHDYEMMIFGGVLMGMMIFMRKGLVPSLAEFIRRRHGAS